MMDLGTSGSGGAGRFHFEEGGGFHLLRHSCGVSRVPLVCACKGLFDVRYRQSMLYLGHGSGTPRIMERFARYLIH